MSRQCITFKMNNSLVRKCGNTVTVDVLVGKTLPFTQESLRTC